jgi:transcriptional regulator with XRE-family HTH domain
MNTMQMLRERLSQPEVNLMDICRRSGVAYGTLWNLRRGVGNPTVQTVDSIVAALDEGNNGT